MVLLIVACTVLGFILGFFKFCNHPISFMYNSSIYTLENIVGLGCMLLSNFLTLDMAVLWAEHSWIYGVRISIVKPWTWKQLLLLLVESLTSPVGSGCNFYPAVIEPALASLGFYRGCVVQWRTSWGCFFMMTASCLNEIAAHHLDVYRHDLTLLDEKAQPNMFLLC